MRTKGLKVSTKNRGRLCTISLRMKSLQISVDSMVIEISELLKKDYLSLSDMAKLSRYFIFLQCICEDDELEYAMPLMKQIWKQK